MGECGGFAPKTRVLTQHESQSSLETWKETLLFNLTLDGKFEMFLEDDFTWKSEAEQNRGLKSDTDGENKKTAKQKLALLNRLLGSIASYAPVISRQYIMKEATSLDAIWQRLRIFYGFRKSGGLILDLTSLSLEEGESPEVLWEKIYAFVMDNLLSPADGLQHLDIVKPAKETMTPTLLNMTVVLWLRAIHPQLPSMVKQKFTTELRKKTLATLREEISESLQAMLAELQGETANISRFNYQGHQKKQYTGSKQKSFNHSKQVYESYKQCPLCEAHHRSTDHFLSECPYLPDSDKKFMLKAKLRMVEVDEEEESEEEEEIIIKPRKKAVKSVNIRNEDVASSPYLNVQYGPNTVSMRLDSGAEINLIELDFAHHLDIPIYTTSTSVSLADGSSNLKVVGEVHVIFTRDNLKFKFDGLVAETLSDKLIVGIPFMSAHDIYARPFTQTIYVGSKEFKYSEEQCHPQTASIMRIPCQGTLLPGDSVLMEVPDSLHDESQDAVKPILSAPSLQDKFSKAWLQPRILLPENSHISLNATSDSVKVGQHEQIAYVHPVDQGQASLTESRDKQSLLDIPSTSTDYLDINLDPDGLLSAHKTPTLAAVEPPSTINWSDSLLAVFKRSQAELKNEKTLTIPRKEDQLQLITDASDVGVDATLYVIRNEKPHIAGYFSANHKNHQASGLPCELKALSICAAVTHFSTDIMNSSQQTMIMTDSLPCVQAYDKLCQGKFSSIPRVSTFLSVLSRYNVHLLHIKGSDNIYSDNISRNTEECTDERCQICKWLADASESVVRSCTVNDILKSTVPVPFSSRSGWHELQSSDPDMRCASAHLRQGTKPSHKETNIPDVKKYRNVARVAKDGLLIIEHYTPSGGKCEKIAVPRAYVHGLLECLHLKLEHPTKTQLLKVFNRAYFALDIKEAVKVIDNACHTCVSLRDMSNSFLHQTTVSKSSSVGSNFSAHIMKKSGQLMQAKHEKQRDHIPSEIYKVRGKGPPARLANYVRV